MAAAVRAGWSIRSRFRSRGSTAALDLSADSAIGPVMLAERESMYRGALPAGAVPLLYPLSIAMGRPSGISVA